MQRQRADAKGCGTNEIKIHDVKTHRLKIILLIQKKKNLFFFKKRPLLH